MPELKIGIQLSSLRQPFRKALETAARVGATAVEIDARRLLKPDDLSDTGRRQLRKTLDDLNLRVCAVGFRTRNGYNVLENLQERIDATKKAMSFAYSLGASVVVNQVGRVPDEPEGPEWDLLVDALREIGNHAHHCGSFLVAETGSESGPDLARLVNALPEGALGVALNPGNLIINSYSPVEAIQSLGRHVMYVRAKDGVRDLAQGRGIEVALGRGSADFPNLIGMLEEHAYRGFFTIERERSDDPVIEIAAAVQYLKNI